MQQQLLTKEQEECLAFNIECARIPIPWKELAKRIGKSEKEINNIVKSMRKDKWLDDKDRMNNKAMVYGIVNLKIPVEEWRKTFPGAIESDPGFAQSNVRLGMQKELSDKDRTNILNIMTYHTYRKYQEWDAFDDDGNFRPMLGKEAQKLIMEVGGAMLDDGRLPVEHVLALYGVPIGMSKKQGLSREDAKKAIAQYLEYL